MEEPIPFNTGSALDPPTIYRSLENKDKAVILLMLRFKFDLEYRDPKGNTVLHALLRNKNLKESDVTEILFLFLNKGVKPNVANVYEVTPLHLAIGRRMKRAVDILLRFGAHINLMNKGDTIAHYFIKEEKLALAKFNHSSITVENYEKTMNDSLHFLEFLISKGVDFDRKNNQGKSAMQLALTSYLQYLLPTLFERTLEIQLLIEGTTLLEFFLDRSLSARLSYRFNKNPYFRYNLSYAVKSVKILLERGVPLEIYNRKGYSLLRKAFEEEQDIVIIKLLIDHWLQNCQDENFATSLFCALLDTCAYWNESDTDYFVTALNNLVGQGAKVNTIDNKCLLTATKTNNLQLLDFLRENGANFYFTDENGRNLIHLLADTKPIEEGPEQDFHSQAWYLKVIGLDVNARCNFGETALHMAVKYRNVPMISTLIDIGADLDCRNRYMRTPLHVVVFSNESNELTELLLRSGAGVNLFDFQNETPLHFAVRNNNLSMAQLLINYGAIVNSKNVHRMETPLHCAALKDASMKIIELLLEHGANVNAKDYLGNTPPHYIFDRMDWDYESRMMMFMKTGKYVNTRNNEGKSILSRALSLKRTYVVRDIVKYSVTLNEPFIEQLKPQILASEYITKVDVLFAQLYIKLKAANLPNSEDYRAYARDNPYRGFNDECLEEIRKLEATFIDKRTSLYRFLQAQPSRKRIYVNNENLQAIIKSPDLHDQYPIYSDWILANYRETEARVSLCERAIESWSTLTNFRLNLFCVDQLFSYLADKDLINIIEANDSIESRSNRNDGEDESKEAQ